MLGLKGAIREQLVEHLVFTKGKSNNSYLQNLRSKEKHAPSLIEILARHQHGRPENQKGGEGFISYLDMENKRSG